MARITAVVVAMVAAAVVGLRAVVDGDDAFSYVCGLGLTRGLLGELDDRTRHGALETLQARLTAHAKSDGVLLGAAGWLVTARRP